jgi:hypothetical protein
VEACSLKNDFYVINVVVTMLGRLDTLKFYADIKKQRVLVMVGTISTSNILYKEQLKRLGLHLDTFP